MPSLYLKIAIAIALAGGGFGAGWYFASNKYQLDCAEEREDRATADLQEANDAIALVNQRLLETAENASQTNIRTQNLLDNLGALEQQHSGYIARVSARTSELENEINQLDSPDCIFGANYGGMWQRISETANTGRSGLYPAGPNSSD